MNFAASSAFPGFFPPIKLHSADIGASESAFSKQTFTDGGVFDNLGIRAFRFIERCWSEACRPTEADGREMEVEEVGAGASGAGEEEHSYGGANGSASARRDPARRAGTVTVRVPEFAAVHRELTERQVLCDFRPDAGIRLGPHFFTSDEELERSLAEIADVVETGAWRRHAGAVALH